MPSYSEGPSSMTTKLQTADAVHKLPADRARLNRRVVTSLLKLAAMIVLIGELMATPDALAQRVSADGATQTFGFLSDQFFSEVYFKFSPTSGTSAGLHQYDTQLEEIGRAHV